MQDIAEAVGMLKGSLYYYMRSKDDLLFAILQTTHEDILKQVEVVERADGDSLSKLTALLKAHIAYNLRNIAHSATFMLDFRSLSSERRRIIIGERDRYEGYLRKLLNDGMADGSLRLGDATLVGRTLLGAINTLYLWYREEGSKSPEEIAETISDLLLYGMASSRPDSAPACAKAVTSRPERT